MKTWLKNICKYIILLLSITGIAHANQIVVANTSANTTTFVAVGGSQIWYSHDGTNWNSAKGVSGNIEFNKVIYAGGKFEAIADEGTILYSSDGVNWKIAQGLGGDASFNSIIYTGERFVVVGTANIGDEDGIFYSTDGINWVAVVKDMYEDFRSVAYNNNTIVVVGSKGSYLYSIDGGKTFKVNYIGADVDFHSVTYAQGKFVATMSDSTIAYTTDITKGWTIAKGLNGEASINKVSYIPELNEFIAIGDDSTAWFSTDGISWTRAAIKGSSNLNNIEDGGNIMLAGGDNTSTRFDTDMRYSTDGKTWHRTDWLNDDQDVSISGVVRYNNFYALQVNQNGYNIVTSSDGINWSTSVQLPNQ